MTDELATSENVDRLEYRFDYSVDDAEAASTYIDTLSRAAPSPASTGWTLWQVVGTVALLSVVPLLLVFGQAGKLAALGRVGLKYVLATFASLFLAVSCLALFFVWRTRRLLQRSAEQTGAEPDRWLCAISAAGFTAGCAPAQVLLPWSAITRVVFTPKLILFHFGAKEFKMLPTRLLPSTAELNRFAACLRKWYFGPVVDGAGNPITETSSLELK